MGADPGYVGFGQVPTIYSKVMMRKYSVVVLDEFEKADASLANPLISILDGQAEDAQARRVDFSQCIFILTSNELGHLVRMNMQEDDIRAELLNSGGIWQAPLVDRIDRIALFQPLDRDTLLEILDLRIRDRSVEAGRPLPAELELPEVRQSILDWAVGGDATGSARRLERALLRWLVSYADRRERDSEESAVDGIQEPQEQRKEGLTDGTLQDSR